MVAVTFIYFIIFLS